MVMMVLTLALGAPMEAVQPGGIDVREVDDAVMAGEAELAETWAWAEAAFAGETVEPAVPIEVKRQDFNTLHFGESCMETPITLADNVYAHGLGTHANSEIVVTLPAGARRFIAFAGVDNNFDTQRARGSVEFSVDLDGAEVARTPILRCGDQPYPISIDIPEGATHLTLKVGTTADGPGWDQCDWADAKLLLADGAEMWLDEGRRNVLLGQDGPPFSFIYGGTPFSEVCKGWTHEVERFQTDEARGYRARWTDPVTRLRVTAEARAFLKYPAVDWVLHFENQGAADSPLIENIQAVDVPLMTGNAKRVGRLHRIEGDVCSEASYEEQETLLLSDTDTRFAPHGGRSSNGAFPFFDVTYADRGLIAAIGWSGQWAASVSRSAAGMGRIRAGMETTRLTLHPGERIRSPRVLLMPFEGSRRRAHNRFRRLMLFHYMPRHAGRPVELPVALQCFDRYSWTRPEWATESGQLDAVKAAADLGFTVHWFDAAWFPGGFPGGVGNWYPKPEAFPNGLKPIADACHARGLKFILWFEPERVGNESIIAREHPEYVHGGAQGGLFKLDDPAARAWLTDLLVKRIAEFGLDIYRQDFNMDPLDDWRRNDAPDRQGMTEIRYVEGLYELWDTLRETYPNLIIDNCSSGGRRIDLETCMRAVPFWRSDTNCTPGHADWNQSHTAGLSRYVPLHMACTWTTDTYTVRSALTAGLICQWDYAATDFPTEQARTVLAEARDLRKYFYGDFYPLVASGPAASHWSATQWHRPDLEEGLVLVFRRPESIYTGIEMALRGLDPNATYELQCIDDHHRTETRMATGKELAEGWEVRLPEKSSSLLIRYRTP